LRKAQRGATLSAKIGTVFVLVCIMALANIGGARIMVREQNGVAEVVNVAGKLRMLSQKIAFEAAFAGHDQHMRSERLPAAGMRSVKHTPCRRLRLRVVGDGINAADRCQQCRPIGPYRAAGKLSQRDDSVDGGARC
jgi:hypothetical protein